MIDLPFNPANIGEDTMLGRFLQDNPERIPVLKTICSLLDDDGRVGDRARYYIVLNNFRRAVFRGTLAALGIPVPSWAYSNRAAALASRKFTDAYWAAQHGRTKRNRAA